MVQQSDTTPILGSRASEVTARAAAAAGAASTATNGQGQDTQTPVYYVQDHYYDEDGFSIYSENTIKRQELYKKLGVAAAVIFTIPLCFFLFIYLPSLAPDATDIPTLVKVGTANSFLHPLVPSGDVPEYGKPKPRKGKGKNKSEIDDQAITGKLPLFQHYKFLDRDSKLFKEYFHGSDVVLPDEQTSKKRYILIGDIHGSLSQLIKLLNKVGFDKSHEHNDHVIMLGDFLDKGPDSIGVLDYAIDNQIDCVLGNHELEILKRYIQFHGLPPIKIKPTKDDSDEGDEDDITLEIRPTESYDLDEMMKIAKRLYPVHIEYLSKCSIIKQIGPVPHFSDRAQNYPYDYPSEGIAVHGGLQWSIENITDQNPDVVLNIRSLLAPDFKIPSDDRHLKHSESWSKHWTLNQRSLFKKKLKEIEKGKDMSKLVTIGTKVFYGHDAGRGLIFREYSTGLDTGCVYGDELTAELIWSEVENDKIVYKRTSTHVDCS